MANELISVRIPNGNKWNLKDIEEKSQKYGMEKSEFILAAIDMLMNFDEVFFKKIQSYAKGLNIPEYIVLQNMVINQFAKEAAEEAAYGPLRKVLHEFVHVTDEKGPRTLTGEELFNVLKDLHLQEINRNMK